MAARSPLLRLLSNCPHGQAAVRQLRPLAAANRAGPLPWRPLTTRGYATATEAPSTSSDSGTTASSPAETILASVPAATPASDPPPAAESKPSPPLSPTDHHDEAAQRLPKYTHQFDTYRLVLALQSAGYSRPQAIALMKCLRTLLIDGTEFAKLHYLSRGDLENETYLFRAAMSELRTEVKTIRHNEALAERSEVIGVQKELDSLNQETKESLENLRNDVTIEMNNRKIASRAEQQGMEVKIQDLNYGFTKRLADMRTEAEAQKWQTTRLLIVTLITMVLTGLGVTRYLLYKEHHAKVASEGVQTDPPKKEPPETPPNSELVTLG